MKHFWNVRVRMRDGVNISADIYLPSIEGAFPTIVIGTPYDNTMKSHVDMASFFVSHEYAFIVYDVRGRHDSDGEFYPFFNEGPDGYDLIEWAAKQPWCNGRLGMMGGSYRGWIQWATAKEKPPNLITMVPTATGGKYLREFPFFNGIPCLWMLGWLNFVGGRTNQNVAGTTVDWERVFKTLPINELPEALGRDLPIWKEWMSHPYLDDFWKSVIFTEDDFKGIDIPMLHITGYYDGDQPGALHYYENIVKYGPKPEQQYMIMGPWDHAGTRFPKRYIGGVDFTKESEMDMKYVHLEWFDYWLKGIENKVRKWPLTRYFIMNENRWHETHENWPINPEKQTYYLHSNGKANSLYGDGELVEKPKDVSKDTLIYNPENPAMLTTSFDYYGSSEEILLDRRYMLRRDDHLVYSSKKFNSSMTVVGSPVVELYVSSDCPDTDFFVSLMNVHPDERSILVSRGLIRARYRNGLEKQELMKQGEIYKITIPMDSTGLQLKTGHKIRLCVTSSEFPRYARNNNTGKPIDSDTEFKIAENTIHHGRTYPSRVLLPSAHTI